MSDSEPEEALKKLVSSVELREVEIPFKEELPTSTNLLPEVQSKEITRTLDQLLDQTQSSKEVPGTINADKTRQTIVIALLSCLGGCLFGIAFFIYLLNPAQSPEERAIAVQLINLVWTSVVTLVSGALAFYFGDKKILSSIVVLRKLEV